MSSSGRHRQWPTTLLFSLYAQSGHPFPRPSLLVVARVYHPYCSLISTEVFLSRHSGISSHPVTLNFDTSTPTPLPYQPEQKQLRVALAQ